MGKEKESRLKKPSKKVVISIGLIVVIASVLWLLASQGLFGGSHSEKVDFKELSKDDIPKSIETDVIPEYRDLERALGCLVDGKVYVVVTRGEKPTAGYEVLVQAMTLEKTKEGSNLKVEAKFKEPEDGVAVSKVTTYPYSVALTELTVLPNTIELIISY